MLSLRFVETPKLSPHRMEHVARGPSDGLYHKL